MNSKKLFAFVAGLALTALAAGCGDTANNTVNNANVVVRNTNANANANMNANANANANANRYSNTNMTREDYERNKEGYAEDARRSGRTIGTGANDGWLWTKVRTNLLTADDLRDSTINVDVDNAVVTLSGTVANGAQKVRAADVAKKTDGVKSVTNKLTVSAGGNANANAAKK